MRECRIMKKHIIAIVILLSLIFSFYSFKCNAEDWPAELCDRQGCFQILGQPQTTYETNFKFHEALDVVGNPANPEEKSYVKCIRTGYLYQYKPEEGQVIILLDTWQPYFGLEEIFDTYSHVKVTHSNISEIDAYKDKFGVLNDDWNGTKIRAGEIIGYMARPLSGEPYGSNAAVHVHYSRTRGERTGFESWVTPYWKIEENPFQIFDDGISSDTTPPIFLNISDSDPDLSFPIDIVDDSETYGQPPCVSWSTYCDSEGEPEHHYDNIIKGRCPWLVKGKVDIWTRAIDFMNSCGFFTKDPSFSAFNIYPVVNRIEYDIKDSNGSSIFPSSPRVLIDFDQFVLDKTRLELNQPYMSVFAPFSDESAGKYREYPHPNLYVVTNTDGIGNPQTSGCWDTTTVPNGIYTIEVTVSDLNSNSATTTMAVEVLNADIYVDDNSTAGDGSIHCPFPSITQALAHVTSGQLIFIAPGLYDNGRETFPLVIPAGITLRGAGIGLTTIQGPEMPDVHVIKCEDLISGITIIEDISITGGGISTNLAGAWNEESVGFGSGIFVKSSPALTIQDCDIYENLGFGIFVFSTTGPNSPLLIRNNIIRENGHDNVRFQFYSDGRLYNNTILAAGIDGVRCLGQGNPRIDSNILYANSSYGIMAVPGGPTFPGSVPQINYCCIYGNGAGSFGGTAGCTAGCIYNNPMLVNDSCSEPFLMQAPLQTPSSSCVDAGHIGWTVYGSTRTDYAEDSGRLDIGFHYSECQATPTPAPIPTPVPVDTCQPTQTPDPYQGAISVIKDYPNDLWRIRVTDPNLPLRQEPSVFIGSKADPIGFTMALPTQTAPDQYEQILEFATAPTPSDPINRLLSVNDPDWVTVTYEDDSPVATVTYETGYSYGTPLPSATPTPTTGPWSETDAYGYTGTAPDAYSWIDATGGNDAGITDDDGYSDVSIPFDFQFYGQLYNFVRISANGYLTFGDNGWAFENTGLPWQEEPNEGIYPLWDDLDPSQGGSVYTMTTCATPNRQFIVEW